MCLLCTSDLQGPGAAGELKRNSFGARRQDEVMMVGRARVVVLVRGAPGVSELGAVPLWLWNSRRGRARAMDGRDERRREISDRSRILTEL